MRVVMSIDRAFDAYLEAKGLVRDACVESDNPCEVYEGQPGKNQAGAPERSPAGADEQELSAAAQLIRATLVK